MLYPINVSQRYSNCLINLTKSHSRVWRMQMKIVCLSVSCQSHTYFDLGISRFQILKLIRWRVVWQTIDNALYLSPWQISTSVVVSEFYVSAKIFGREQKHMRLLVKHGDLWIAVCKPTRRIINVLSQLGVRSTINAANTVNMHRVKQSIVNDRGFSCDSKFCRISNFSPST